jgi:hypothetical protein
MHKEIIVERRKFSHEVGSVYIPEDRRRRMPFNHAENDFDETFMQGVIGSFVGSMLIFGTFFAIILFI